MARGIGSPCLGPIGWCFIDRHRHDGFTIRWARGEPFAYVLAGRRMSDFSTEGPQVLGRIPVILEGWTDQAQIRALGERWVRAHNQAQGA